MSQFVLQASAIPVRSRLHRLYHVSIVFKQSSAMTAIVSHLWWTCIRRYRLWSQTQMAPLDTGVEL